MKDRHSLSALVASLCHTERDREGGEQAGNPDYQAMENGREQQRGSGAGNNSSLLPKYLVVEVTDTGPGIEKVL
jgi:hypothetical protein